MLIKYEYERNTIGIARENQQRIKKNTKKREEVNQ
jgi:hypothetical protein